MAATLADGLVVRAFPVRDFWSDLGTPEDLAAAEAALGPPPVAPQAAGR